MEWGLAKSRNTMTARIGEMATLENVVEITERLGLGKVTEPSPQLYIGNHGATLKSLTSAYSSLATGGHRFTPFVIEKIENSSGELVFAREPNSYVVMTGGAAWCVTTMLEKVLSPMGTGAQARSLGYKGKAAGKTGTTDDYKDAWFVGYHRRMTCGVWVGLDQPETIAAKAYGSKMALPIWVDAMKAAERLGCPDESPRPDVELERVTLCSASGRVAGGACGGHTVTTEMPVDILRTEPCSVHGGRSGWSRRKSSSGGSSGSSPGVWGTIRRWFGG
jgi:penicillin-binding protein 1A